MATPYKISIHTGNAPDGPFGAGVPFAFGGAAMKSTFLQYNVWDASAYVQWELTPGVFSPSIELDNNWQPILVPFAALGFRIINKQAGVIARYQIIATAG